jgi:hypothetical protein
VPIWNQTLPSIPHDDSETVLIDQQQKIAQIGRVGKTAVPTVTINPAVIPTFAPHNYRAG